VPEIPRSQLVAYTALAIVIGLLGARYVRSAPAGGAQAAAPAAHPVTFSSGGRRATVHVAGAVRHPGVYELGPGARVQDAVRRAGGARGSANLDAVNLAARVADGQQIIVPAAVGAAVVPGADPAAVAPSAPVSLGSATLEQLETLDGVGPATAQKIVAYRTEHGGFRSVDDLANVPGIGPKKLAAIKPHAQP
jgi:competence protein ComEA